MKLKLIGDGTEHGTIVVDATTGSELEHLKEFGWTQHQGNASSITLRVGQITFDLNPTKPFNRYATTKGLLKSATFRLKVIGDGTTQGTAVVDADTEEEIEGITSKFWEYDVDQGEMVLVLDIDGREAYMSIDPTAPMLSGGFPFNPQAIATSSAPASTPTPSHIPSSSYSSSPPYGGAGYGPAGTPGINTGSSGGNYNPYANPNSQPSYSACPPTQSDEPLLPPDMMSMSASKCPLCGTSDAYIGFNSIECSNTKCAHFKK